MSSDFWVLCFCAVSTEGRLSLGDFFFFFLNQKEKCCLECLLISLQQHSQGSWFWALRSVMGARHRLLRSCLQTWPICSRSVLPPALLSGCTRQSDCTGQLWQSNRSCKNSCLTFPAAFKNKTTNKEVEWNAASSPVFLWMKIVLLGGHLFFPNYLSTQPPFFSLYPTLPPFLLTVLSIEKNLPASVSMSFFHLNFLLAKGTLYFFLFLIFSIFCAFILIHLCSFGFESSQMCSFMNSSVSFMLPRCLQLAQDGGQAILKQNESTLQQSFNL